jgi:hypothetical protein
MWIFAMMVTAGVNIQFLDGVAERKQLVPCASRADLTDHDAKRIGCGENVSAQVFAIGFENRANFLHHIAGLAGSRVVEISEYVTVGPVPILRGFITVPFADRGIEQTDPREFKAFTIDGLVLEPIPNTLKKKHIVRQHNDLHTILAAFLDFLYRAILPETVLAVEGIIKNDNFPCLIRVVDNLSKKKGERKGAFITGTESISETWSVDRRFRVPQIHRLAVDQNLIARTGDTTKIIMFRASNTESGVKIIEHLIDGLLIAANDLFCMLIELHADCGLPHFDPSFFSKRLSVLGAIPNGVRLVTPFHRSEIGQFTFDSRHIGRLGCSFFGRNDGISNANRLIVFGNRLLHGGQPGNGIHENRIGGDDFKGCRSLAIEQR